MDELAALNFVDDLEEAKADPESSRWSLEQGDGFEVVALMAPLRAPNETFLSRHRWIEYPGRLPPSVTFLDPETRAEGVGSAWPVAAGFSPPTVICANWTAEGFGLHPEWLNDAGKRWDNSGNVILASLRILQHELDRSFQKRFSQ